MCSQHFVSHFYSIKVALEVEMKAAKTTKRKLFFYFLSLLLKLTENIIVALTTIL